MDNLSHTFAGAWAAEALNRLLPTGDAKNPETIRDRRRALFMTASVLANNAPDLDLVLSGLLPSPLGYLLHHRGHTHTIGFLVMQIALVVVLVLCIPRFRFQMRTDTRARAGTIGLAGIGLLLHLALDALNSYGVHPFWPFQSDWFYGDLVFIIEPALWAGFGVPVLFALKSKWARLGGMIPLLAVPMAASFVGIVPILSVVVYLACVAGLAWGTRTWHRPVALGAGLAVVVAFLSLLSVTQNAARSEVRMLGGDPRTAVSETELDIILSPLPLNPLCWSYVRISTDSAAQTYALQRGTVSAWPSALPHKACQNKLRENGLVPTREQNSLHALRARAARDCWFRAWMRFARAPSVTAARATDWRFLSQGENNFTTLPLAGEESRDCPGWIPPWRFPRRDLIEN